jgi:hypothetical protein
MQLPYSVAWQIQTPDMLVYVVEMLSYVGLVSRIRFSSLPLLFGENGPLSGIRTWQVTRSKQVARQSKVN